MSCNTHVKKILTEIGLGVYKIFLPQEGGEERNT